MRTVVFVVAALAAGFGLAEGNTYVSYRSFLKQPEMTSVFAEMVVTTRCFASAPRPHDESAARTRRTSTADSIFFNVFSPHIPRKRRR